eukprot:714917-Heterocapsa_arctica.AAC.1
MAEEVLLSFLRRLAREQCGFRQLSQWGIPKLSDVGACAAWRCAGKVGEGLPDVWSTRTSSDCSLVFGELRFHQGADRVHDG